MPDFIVNLFSHCEEKIGDGPILSSRRKITCPSGIALKSDHVWKLVGASRARE